MALTKLLKVVAAPLFFSALVLTAGDAANASQNAVVNTMNDESVDQATVQKYKSLFAEEQHKLAAGPASGDSPTATNWQEIFDGDYKWTDIIDATKVDTTCSPSCYACPAGCNFACCTGSGNSTFSPARGGGGGGGRSASTTTTAPPPQQTEPVPDGRGRPNPLACPCYCGPSCPTSIQAICCFTGGSDAEKDKGHVGSGADPQKPILDDEKQKKPHPDDWQSCPCSCQPSCPGWIQAICCYTGGSDGPLRPSPPENVGHESPGDMIGLVTETASGEPVAVLAGVNITVEQSFVTMELVRGLERGDEITYDERQKIFEIVLPLVVGPADDQLVVDQSFQVIDGSRLFEQEQIMFGLKFMARIGSLTVDRKFHTTLQAGLPVVAGTEG
jgi:hypothetical protein